MALRRPTLRSRSRPLEADSLRRRSYPDRSRVLNAVRCACARQELAPLLEALGDTRVLPRLSQLWLLGNPLCLRRGYREAVVRALPALKVLDGVPVERGGGAAEAGADAGTEDGVSLCFRFGAVSGLRIPPPPEEPTAAAEAEAEAAAEEAEERPWVSELFLKGPRPVSESQKRHKTESQQDSHGRNTVFVHLLETPRKKKRARCFPVRKRKRLF